MPWRRRGDFSPCRDYGCKDCGLRVCACCELWEEYDVDDSDIDAFSGKRLLIGKCQGPFVRTQGRPAVLRPNGEVAIPQTIFTRDTHMLDSCPNWRAVRPDPDLGESLV